jgi:hypothetical protein
MKNLIFAVIFLSISFSAKAQPLVVTNNNSCDIAVTQYCYNAGTCKLTKIVGPVVVPFRSTDASSFSVNPCGPGGCVVYEVCWSSTLCSPNPCTWVDGTLPTACGCGYSHNAILPACADCTQTCGTCDSKVDFSAPGNLTAGWHP